MTTIEHEIARKHGLAPEIVLSIIEVESGGDQYAVRYEPNWRWFLRISYWASKLRITDKTERMLQSCSFGPMQIIGATSRELGFTGSLVRLCSLTGVEYGCKYLRKQLDRYEGNVKHAIAAYNAGSARIKRNGKYRNQQYVDKVMAAYGNFTKKA